MKIRLSLMVILFALNSIDSFAMDQNPDLRNDPRAILSTVKDGISKLKQEKAQLEKENQELKLALKEKEQLIQELLNQR